MGKREKFKSMTLAKKTETLQVLPVWSRGKWLQMSMRGIAEPLQSPGSQRVTGKRECICGCYEIARGKYRFVNARHILVFL